MSILVLGDFTIPYSGCIDVDPLIHLTERQIVIGNLEGPIITNNGVQPIDRYKINLCTNRECVDYLKKLNISYLCLANNHALDFDQTLDETISILKDEGIDFFGTAEKPYVEFLNADRTICIWGAASFITGRTANKYDEVNDYNPVRLLHQISDYKNKNPETYLIMYLHWGYEFATFPQPADREWAHKSIEVGVNAVIGLHPHAVQGIEKYKNGIIVYSLGNHILPASALTRPRLSKGNGGIKSDLLHLPKIGIEIDLSTNEIRIQEFLYDKQNSQLLYLGESGADEANISSYSNLSADEYRKWYKMRKYKGEQRRRFNVYPIFYSYFRFYNAKFFLSKIYLTIFKVIRRLLIDMKLHTPASYHELTKLE